MLIAGCVTWPWSPAGRSVTADLPATARAPCALPVLPAEGPVTWADLEAAYLARGEALIVCDQARRLAVAGFEAVVARRD